MKISCIISNSAKTNVFWRKLRQTAWGSFTDLMFGSMCDCAPICICVYICVCLCLNIFGCEREINTWSSNSTQNSVSVFVCRSYYADICVCLSLLKYFKVREIHDLLPIQYRTDSEKWFSLCTSIANLGPKTTQR